MRARSVLARWQMPPQCCCVLGALSDVALFILSSSSPRAVSHHGIPWTRLLSPRRCRAHLSPGILPCSPGSSPGETGGKVASRAPEPGLELSNLGQVTGLLGASVSPSGK